MAKTNEFGLTPYVLVELVDLYAPYSGNTPVGTNVVLHGTYTTAEDAWAAQRSENELKSDHFHHGKHRWMVVKTMAGDPTVILQKG